MEDIKEVNNKTRSTYFSSIVFFWVVVLLTVLIYFYNIYLLKEVKAIQANINEIDTSIIELEKDKSIQIYSLIELNKNVIKSYESMNDITKFLNHLNDTKRKYNLEFTWFDLMKWEIILNAKAKSDNKWNDYQKIRDFISNYRKDKNAMFNLGFVTEIEWIDEIKFKVNFKIK